MEMALSVVSIVSFFALIVSWTILPTSERITKAAPSAAPSPAH